MPFFKYAVLLLSKYYAGKIFAYNTSKHSHRLVLIGHEIFVSEFQYNSAFFAWSICCGVICFLFFYSYASTLFFSYFHFLRLLIRESFFWCFPEVLTSGIERLLARVKLLLVFSCCLTSGIYRHIWLESSFNSCFHILIVQHYFAVLFLKYFFYGFHCVYILVFVFVYGGKCC